MWKESIRKSVLNQRTINYEFKKLSDFVNNSETQSRFNAVCNLLIRILVTSSFAPGQWYISNKAANMFMASPVIVIRFGATHIGTNVTT